ncbi:MAG TPA: hypothetical protein VM032_16820 [Vicinamibacterales bacterium]|nr:hypothetical protein [Vicinamibacterales bacterium]
MSILPNSTRIADAVSEHLALSEAEHIEDKARLMERNAHLEGMIESYQAVTRAALQVNARLTRQIDSKTRQLQMLRDEFAAFRAAVMKGDVLQVRTSHNLRDHRQSSRLSSGNHLVANQSPEGAACH